MGAENMEPCPPTPPFYQTTEKIEAIAIQHVLSELMKVLQCVTPGRQIDARNRMDIPHGMFGLSLKMFFERRAAEDTSYIDALRIICPVVLQNAKNCIVLDGVHDLISQLAGGHRAGNQRPALMEIEQSTRLLGICDEISSEHAHNVRECAKLAEKLKSFDGEAKRRERVLELKKDTVLDQVSDERQVIGPIEFRYTQKFRFSFQNCRFKCQKREEDLQKALEEVTNKHKQEIECSMSVRSKLEHDMRDLKYRLSKMEETYSKDVDEVNNLVGYSRNRVELLESKMRECCARLIMFAEEVPILTAWLIEFEEAKNGPKVEEIPPPTEEKKIKSAKGKRRK